VVEIRLNASAPSGFSHAFSLKPMFLVVYYWIFLLPQVLALEIDRRCARYTDARPVIITSFGERIKTAI
jgi:hypothetical protein